MLDVVAGHRLTSRPVLPSLEHRLLSPLDLLSQAVKLGDQPSLLEYSSLLARTGREQDAMKLLGSCSPIPAVAQSHPASALLAASALLPVHLQLQLGELEATRQLLDALLPQQPSSCSQQGADMGKVGCAGGRCGACQKSKAVFESLYFCGSMLYFSPW